MGLIDGRKAIAGIAALALAFGFVETSRADTIEAALVRAYQNNPQLNAQRASVRATDENVPQALSGYRPRVAVTANVGEQYHETTDSHALRRAPPTYTRLRGNNAPRSVGATVNADPLQRLPDRQPRASGRKPGVLGTRRTCACWNRRCCCPPPRSTWTICAMRPSSRSSAATSACSSRRSSRCRIASASARSPAPTSRNRRRSSPPAGRSC